MSHPTDPAPPASGDGKPDEHAGVRHRIEAFIERNKMVGVPTPFEHPIEMFLGWWKHIGLRSALLLAVLVLLPSLKYVIGPHVASSAVETWAETLGLDLEVGDWSLDLHDLEVTAHDVKVKARGRYSHPNLIEARAVVIDASLLRRLGGKGWIEEVTLEDPIVFLERSITGRWNWGELRESRELLHERAQGGNEDTLTVKVSRSSGASSPDFSLPVVRAHKLRLDWTQNMPAQSGSGVVQTLQGTVYVEDVDLTIEDVAGFVDGRRTPTRFSFEGRTADGKINADGQANFFQWQSGRVVRPEPPARAAGGHAPEGIEAGIRWAPAVQATLYLEHVGAAALGRLVPTAALVPTAGSLSGQVRLALDQDHLACQTTLTATDLAYAPNLESPVVRPRAAEITKQLVGFKASGPVLIGCEGRVSDSAYRPLEVIQTSITQEVTRQGPPAVRAASTMDRSRVAGTLGEMTTEALSAEFTRQLTKASTAALGATAGSVVEATLTGSGAEHGGQPSEKASQGNPVSRGIKGLGSGVKRLFGGGDKKKP